MLMIRKYWSGYSPGYIKNEGPDWVNPSDSVGIEVTRSMSKHDGYTNSFSEKYFGEKRDNIPTRRLEEFRGQLFFHEDSDILIALSPTKGLIDSSYFYNQIVQSFRGKVEKLQIYELLRTMVLYIYTPFSLNQKEIVSLLDVFSIKTGLYFHIVFLDTTDQLITYDIEAKTYKIDEKLGDMKALMVQAKELVSYSIANKQVVIFDDMIRSCFNHAE